MLSKGYNKTLCKDLVVETVYLTNKYSDGNRDDAQIADMGDEKFEFLYLASEPKKAYTNEDIAYMQSCGFMHEVTPERNYFLIAI